MIYFVRHGKTDYNKKNLLSGGDIDIPLNSEGKEQAKITAKLLKDVKFDMVFCSPLIRAKKTCEEIMKFHKNIPVIYDSRIVEIKKKKNNGIVSSEFDKYMFVKKTEEGHVLFDVIDKNHYLYSEFDRELSRYFAKEENLGEAIKILKA